MKDKEETSYDRSINFDYDQHEKSVAGDLADMILAKQNEAEDFADHIVGDMQHRQTITKAKPRSTFKELESEKRSSGVWAKPREESKQRGQNKPPLSPPPPVMRRTGNPSPSAEKSDLRDTGIGFYRSDKKVKMDMTNYKDNNEGLLGFRRAEDQLQKQDHEKKKVKRKKKRQLSSELQTLGVLITQTDIQSLRKNFSILDSNGDGVLSKAELK